jgi:hypothetical protein
MNNKEKYGEVFTPVLLIKMMYDMLETIKDDAFTNTNYTWLDPAAGTGRFGNTLVEKGVKKRQITQVEINSNYKNELLSISENTIIDDFINFSRHTDRRYDFVVGNPPFNFGGFKKVPTGSGCKKYDGSTLWREMLKSSMKLLKPEGFLCFIIPSIWMKPDKHKMYNYITQFKIHYLHCYTNTESNKLFGYNCQTPTNLLILQNIPVSSVEIPLYCSSSREIHKLLIPKNAPIPLQEPFLYNLLMKKCELYGSIRVYKTSTLPRNYTFSNTKDEIHKYLCVKTCKLDKSKEPYVVENYCSHECPYANESKLVLCHKMYGFPFMDLSGSYGISSRDNYVILQKDYSIEQLNHFCEFLSTSFAMKCFDMTRYRMSYLEKYVFEILPNIPLDVDVSSSESICDWLNIPHQIKERLCFSYKNKYKNYGF